MREGGLGWAGLRLWLSRWGRLWVGHWRLLQRHARLHAGVPAAKVQLRCMGHVMQSEASRGDKSLEQWLTAMEQHAGGPGDKQQLHCGHLPAGASSHRPNNDARVSDEQDAADLGSTMKWL